MNPSAILAAGDSSTVVAALVDNVADGQWAETMHAAEPLAAPHLMPAKVANIQRGGQPYRRTVGRCGVVGVRRPVRTSGEVLPL